VITLHSQDNSIKLEIGRRIREQRKLNGFKTKQTYEHLKLPRTTYTGYEMGTRTPDPATMNKIADYLNTTVSYLMCETDNPNPNTNITAFEDLLEDKILTFKGEPLSEEQLQSLYNYLKTINDQNEKEHR
jgi:transcriptional regulator with XRE-family HTH domain